MFSPASQAGSLWTAMALGTVVVACATSALAHQHPKHSHRDQPHRAAHADAPAKAAPAAKAAVEQVEQIEQVEAVEAGPAAATDDVSGHAGPASATGAPHLSLQQLVAHLHPALVHMPIAWLLLWLVCELGGGRLLQLRGAVPTLAWATVLAFMPATLTGLLHVAELPQDPASLQPVMSHRNSMLAAGAACAALAIWRHRLAAATASPAWARSAYLAVLTATLLAVSISAHWGGQLVYGDDYLPF